MANDITDQAKVRAHVDFWFVNTKGGDLFDPAEPAVSALDYSLQIEASIVRVCRACKNGDLAGPTPGICRDSKFYDEPTCRAPIMTFDAAAKILKERMEEEPSPRQ